MEIWKVNKMFQMGAFSLVLHVRMRSGSFPGSAGAGG